MDLQLYSCLLVILSLSAANGRYLANNETMKILLIENNSFTGLLPNVFDECRGKCHTELEDETEGDVSFEKADEDYESRAVSIPEFGNLDALDLPWEDILKNIIIRELNGSVVLRNTFLGSRGKREAALMDKNKLKDLYSAKRANSNNPKRKRKKVELNNIVENNPSGPRKQGAFNALRGRRNVILKNGNKLENSYSGEDATRYIPTRRKRNTELDDEAQDNSFPEGENRYTPTRNKRIAGGADAAEEEFPYQVSLRYEGLHICGGALISDQHVLTAAHCICGIIDEPYDELTVVSGSVTIDKGGQSHVVKDVHCHSNFTYGLEHSWENDIAVITLSHKVSRNDAQSPVKLPSSDAIASQPAVITGWGRSSTEGYLHKNLQILSLNILSNDKCQSYYNNTVLPSQICTFNGKGVGACKGDSGSPLVLNDTVIGIFSWTKPCGIGSPEVFTKVHHYLNFIESSMKGEMGQKVSTVIDK